MKLLSALGFSLLIPACVDLSTTEQDLNGAQEPHDARIFYARGNARPGGGGGSPNLIWHGGPVMTSGAYVEATFWGPSWGNSAFVGDKISGLTSFYSGMGNSGYDSSNAEYTDGNGNVGSGVTFGGAHVDTSTAAKNGQRTSTILAEACANITNVRADGYYPVYIDNSRGHSGYCAWHSTGTCNGVQVQFAFFYNLDGDPGCDPGDNTTGHSQGLAALANVSGHELSEALTDPHLDAWYDASGAENSDKCAWTFGHDSVPFQNGTSWKIQGNWSNAAYNSHSGYDGAGCIDN